MLERLGPVSLVALLATLVLLFGFQGEQILAQPLVIAMLAVPILIQVYFNAGVAYLLNRVAGERHCVAGPSALIGASNFFELAVAAAISLFGFNSGAALATVVGVLIEVPVMLSAVWIVNNTREWYEREGRSHCRGLLMRQARKSAVVKGATVKSETVSADSVRSEGAVCGTPLLDDEFEAFSAALIAAGLPADDLREPNVKPFRFARNGSAVGYGALELYGRDVLLRSIVVAPAARRDGVGRAIVNWLLALAARSGADRAFLFATDARAYFEALRFEAIDRSLAPPTILTTRQASGLCPASAALLTRAVPQ